MISDEKHGDDGESSGGSPAARYITQMPYPSTIPVNLL